MLNEASMQGYSRGISTNNAPSRDGTFQQGEVLKTASAEPRKSKEDATHEKQSRGRGPLDVFAEPMEPEAYF